MKDGNSIEVYDVKKKFRVYFDKGRTLKEKVLFKNRNRYDDRWVLKGISFEVKKGEALGIIGENGCGKSTTLKLLTKIMYPDSGSIEIKGRVSSLIELGAGFHPDMTGRENIYTNASIFGLTKKEIDNRINDIIDFSELHEYLDNPVRTYSSGMYMRLAFSVAINVNADVLLIDEILAVGDANFQSKCFNKLRELKASGVTIVIVTHDLGVVENFCDSAIWIDAGKIVSRGKATTVVDDYMKHMNDKKIQTLMKQEKESATVNVNDKKQQQKEDHERPDKDDLTCVNKSEIDYTANHFGLGYIVIENAYFKNMHGEKTNVLVAGEKVEIVIHYKVNKPLDEYVFGMGFYDLDGRCIIGSNTQLDRLCIKHTQMNGTVKFIIEELPLLTGKYILNVAIVDKNGTPMDFYRDYCHFDVISYDRSVGYVSIKHKWDVST
ncbi:MAG: ABC-2 type transport system ATP-binding protein [Lachnoclostridium sp.]|jgi:ABC-2 type transport system ATP-binding protein